jgi:hypothetical protein
MVYVAEKNNNSQSQTGIPVLLDPVLIKAARQIYDTYCRLHSKLNKTPIGVAIDAKTHRGQLLFTKKPILLPRENFIPVEQLKSGIS